MGIQNARMKSSVGLATSSATFSGLLQRHRLGRQLAKHDVQAR